ncbi:MAG: peptidoglycan-associated lipoprotein Pal [Deltaproteobacteria bacterium]|nr:peptidoglycan-associated lipoprotein Pal [Deltaproteobacteria bacterium]
MRSVCMRSWRILGVFLLTLLVSGCPKQQQGPGDSDLSGPGGAGGLGSSGIQDRNLAAKDPGQRTRERIEREGADRGAGGPLSDVYFDYDAFDLSTEARNALQSHADWLKNNSGAKVEIEGHCDERGTVEYNLALGAKRAKAARDYLVNLGVDANQLSTISYGEELPACKESTEDCWQQNRRAHFLLVGR